jgi:ABC-type uncharacterized transport system permease subunit
VCIADGDVQLRYTTTTADGSVTGSVYMFATSSYRTWRVVAEEPGGSGWNSAAAQVKSNNIQSILRRPLPSTKPVSLQQLSTTQFKTFLIVHQLLPTSTSATRVDDSSLQLKIIAYHMQLHSLSQSLHGNLQLCLITICKSVCQNIPCMPTVVDVLVTVCRWCAVSWATQVVLHH